MLLDPHVVESLARKRDLLLLWIVFDTPEFHLRAFIKIVVESELVDEAGALVHKEVEADVITKVRLEIALKLR